MTKKTQLAFIETGDKGQAEVTQGHVAHLRQALTSFELKKYNFNEGEQDELLKDFQAGRVDVVLKNCHGRREEVWIEEWLEDNNIPFFGADSKATALATNKKIAKDLYKKHNLPLAKDILVDQSNWKADKDQVLDSIEDNIGFPCIVKDVVGADSRGLYVVKSRGELDKLFDKVLSSDTTFLVEELIHPAYELTCLVVDNDEPYAFEPVRMATPAEGPFTAEAKDKVIYRPQVPSRLAPAVIDRIKQVSIAAHQALGCRHFSRADLMVKGDKIYLLEVDVHAGFQSMSPTTLSVKYEGKSLDEVFLGLYERLEKNS